MLIVRAFSPSFGFEYNKNLKSDLFNIRVALIDPLLFHRKVADKLEVYIIL
jgi:hypothetical protein